MAFVKELVLLILCFCVIHDVRCIRHGTNLIWAQIPTIRTTVSRLVGIEGDPNDWVVSGKVNVRHISAPHFGWEFKALAFQHSTQTLLWSEAMNKRIQSLVLNGSTDTNDVFVGTSPEVYGMSVDWLSGNLYWADALYNWIIMAPILSTDRIYKIIIQRGLDSPHGVAVYPQKGYLIWSDWGERAKIEMSDLLGNNRTMLVDTNIQQPRGLAIDFNEDTLYWADSVRDTVECIGLNGYGRRIVTIQDGSNFFSVALYGKYLFVTEQSKGHLKIYDKKTGTNYISYRLGYVPFGIVMYDESLQEGNSSDCDAMECSQICIPDSLIGPSCICGEGYNMTDDGKTCERTKSFVQPSHIYAIQDAICHYPANIADMSLTNVTLDTQCFLNDRHGYLALTYDSRDNLLYYSENNTKTISRIRLEIGAIGEIIAGGTGVVKGLTLDWDSGQLYWTDSSNRQIKVSKKDGTFQKTLIDTNLVNPLGIAVHPGLGTLYWTDPCDKPKVEWSYIDGSSRTVIMDENLGSPNHLYIDFRTNTLYWTDSKLFHVRSYIISTGRIAVIYSQPNTKFYGISLFKDFLLWTDTEQMNGIHVARLDKAEKVRGIIHPANGIAQDLISTDRNNQPTFEGACAESRTRCEQLCLSGENESAWCHCGLGYELASDRSSCKAGLVDDYFLLVTDAYQRQVFQVNGLNGVVHAIHHSIRHSPIAVDFDPMTQRVFWSDNEAHIIKSTNLGGNFNDIVVRLPEKAVVDGLAVDHINRLLYYTDSGQDMIGVVSLINYTNHRTLIVDSMDEPRAIVLSPMEGRMYWTDWGHSARIESAKMDGSDRKTLVKLHNNSWPNGLALDNREQMLYWADAQLNTIEVVRVNGTDHRVLIKEDTAHYFGLTQMGNYLYVTDWKKTYISRMNKNGGAMEPFGTNSFTKLYGIHGFNGSEVIIGTSVCLYQVCQHLCLPLPNKQYTCQCRDGFILHTDRVTCFKVNKTTTVLPSSTKTTTTTIKSWTTSINGATSPTATSSMNTWSSSSAMSSSVSGKMTSQPMTTTSPNTTTTITISSSTVKAYNPKSSDKGIPRGVIIAIALVVLVALLSGFIVAVYFYRRHRELKIPHGKLVDEDSKVVSFYRIAFPENRVEEPTVDCGIENPTYGVVGPDEEKKYMF